MLSTATEATRLYQFITSQGIYGSSIDIKDDDFDGYLSGYHFQYEIGDALVNVAILSFIDSDSDCGDKEDDLINRMNDVQTFEEKEDTLDPDFDDRQLQVEDEMREWIETECHATFLEILADTEVPKGPPTLYQYLRPEIINLEVKTVDGKVVVIQYGEKPPWPLNMRLGHPNSVSVRLSVNESFPVYRSTQVNIIDSAGVLQVTLGGSTEIVRCKLIRSERDTTREHNVYMKLSAAEMSHVRVPKFKGYVKDSETGAAIIGLLIENIDSEPGYLHYAMGIIDRPGPDAQPPQLASIQRRRKWARQIRDIVQDLHRENIVWGDAKPGNVVIDKKDDAWLIDFGTGFTEPWVYFEDSDSKEGDLKALERMTDWLETGKEPPIHARDKSEIKEALDKRFKSKASRSHEADDINRQAEAKELLSTKRKRDVAGEY